jgi:hypothetical protein
METCLFEHFHGSRHGLQEARLFGRNKKAESSSEREPEPLGIAPGPAFVEDHQTSILLFGKRQNFRFSLVQAGVDQSTARLTKLPRLDPGRGFEISSTRPFLDGQKLPMHR